MTKQKDSAEKAIRAERIAGGCQSIHGEGCVSADGGTTAANILTSTPVTELTFLEVHDAGTGSQCNLHLAVADKKLRTSLQVAEKNLEVFVLAAAKPVLPSHINLDGSLTQFEFTCLGAACSRHTDFSVVFETHNVGFAGQRARSAFAVVLGKEQGQPLLAFFSVVTYGRSRL